MKKEYKIKINGNEYNIVVGDMQEDAGSVQVEVNGAPYEVVLDKPLRSSGKLGKPAAKPSRTSKVVNESIAPPVAPVTKPVAASSGAGTAIKSPLPGVVLDVNINAGDTVKIGQKLLVLEAMKMENVISSDVDGKVSEIKVGKGDSVLEGAELIIIV